MDGERKRLKETSKRRAPQHIMSYTEEGNEYVIETKDKSKSTAASDLHPRERELSR
jgi:hypothetical protein